MKNKWKFPTENVMEKYFSMCEQLEKSRKKIDEDLIQEKELLKKLEEIKQRKEAFRMLKVEFGDLGHIIKNARPPKRTHHTDPQSIIDREKTMQAIQDWKDKNQML